MGGNILLEITVIPNKNLHYPKLKEYTLENIANFSDI